MKSDYKTEANGVNESDDDLISFTKTGSVIDVAISMPDCPVINFHARMESPPPTTKPAPMSEMRIKTPARSVIPGLF